MDVPFIPYPAPNEATYNSYAPSTPTLGYKSQGEKKAQRLPFGGKKKRGKKLLYLGEKERRELAEKEKKEKRKKR